jgi:hypothetical protein
MILGCGSFQEKNIQQMVCCLFMDPDGSISYSEEPASGPSPKPDEFSPPPHIFLHLHPEVGDSMVI